MRDVASVGSGLRLFGAPEIIHDGGRIILGSRVTIASRPVTTHLVAGPDAVLTLGDDVWIGHGGAIAAYERLEIGRGTQIGPFAIIMDTNFHGNTGDQSVLHDTRPIIIGRNCRIGSRVTITRGASIGDGATILAGSVVSSEIPAGMCAGGARAHVLGPVGEVDGWPQLMLRVYGDSSPPVLDARSMAAELAGQFGVTSDELERRPVRGGAAEPADG